MKFTKLLTFCCMLMFWANPMFAEIRTAQKQLNKMGYQAGLADGVWGNKTENAVKLFLSDNDQKWDGTFDQNEIKLIAKMFLTNGFKNTLKNEAFLLPQDVYESFQNLKQSEKSRHCGGIGRNALSELDALSASQPPRKIEGYNSRMDNMADVPGAEQTELFFLRLSEASTSAIFANETEAGNKALAALEYWAKNNALTETKQCYSSKGLSKECEKAWTQKDGQDLAPKMDSSAVQKHINHASYAYFSGLNNINSNDNKHEVIQSWLKSFEPRNKKPKEPYFGLDFGWYWPAIFKNREKIGSCFSDDCPKNLIKKLIKSLNKFVLKDGSLKDRTTRGDRALHYHNEALFEVIITLELARKYGVAIPKSLESKVEKAGDIFVNGFFDHSYMDKWAKKAFKAKYTPGKQRFKSDLNKLNYGTSWYFIFAYRYPESNLAQKLNSLFPIGTRVAKRDSAIGVGLGCVYRALTQTN